MIYYSKYSERYPELPNVIPQYHIASFWGIENPSLSRIIKRLNFSEPDIDVEE